MVASPTPTPTVNSTQDADELRTQQQLIAELKFLRSENEGLKAEVAAKDSTIAVQTRMIQIEVERGDFFKTAAEKGIKVGDNCGLIAEKYDRMVATYDAEVKRLQSENDKLRTSRNWRTAVAFTGGALGGYWASQRGCK
jgi:hypothetical protein